MRQLYLIGILVAIVLLALLGLSKLGGNAPGDESLGAAVEADIMRSAQLEEDVTQEDVMDTTKMTDAAVPLENTTVVLKTNKGDITVELYTVDMPITAGNFLKLAQEDFYDGVKFHRVIEGFMIQGGDPLTKDDSMQARWGTGGPGYAIQDEFGPGYSNTRGTLSMANAGPNTGGSQFFINTADNTFLDGKHPVFGKVTAGMDVVAAISATQTGARDVPVEPILIEDIVVSAS